MSTPTEKTPSLDDLEHRTQDAVENGVADAEADAVKGGRKAGGGQQEYLTVTMNDVLISSYSAGASEGQNAV